VSGRAFARALGAVLAEARRARGLTQEEVSEIAEFDVTYPSLVERGLREPKLSSFLRLCAALGRTPDDLLTATLFRLGSAGGSSSEWAGQVVTPPTSSSSPNHAAAQPSRDNGVRDARTVPRREELALLRTVTPTRPTARSPEPACAAPPAGGSPADGSFARSEPFRGNAVMQPPAGLVAGNGYFVEGGRKRAPRTETI
jgi:transcriptional regulator with XRE-family HTH domain